ncbi:VOC family protein [Luteibacter sp.]|jgi:catechol 2,3-dioxygenase-like lactoylglutathione lyase family enzyme|uniref:VOC family protein n=1 Tax=Luteibacter sp. TaxID=1886636 RepID=UPI002F3EAA60
MDISIYSSFLPQIDPEASLAFYRDTLGFEVRKDVAYGGMRFSCRCEGRPPRPSAS